MQIYLSMCLNLCFMDILELSCSQLLNLHSLHCLPYTSTCLIVYHKNLVFNVKIFYSWYFSLHHPLEKVLMKTCKEELWVSWECRGLMKENFMEKHPHELESFRGGGSEKIPLQWKVLKNGQVCILFWLE